MSEKTKNVRYALMGLLLFFCAAAMQAQTVSGNVKDATGEPIIGATVMEKGTQNGTVTDFDGNFTITLKGNGNKLDISYVGMQTQTVDVAGKSSVNVSLKDDAQMLDEVVAIGYGTVRKKDLTGAVSQVNAKQIENIPVSDVTQALTGKMSGVNITTTEGSPDAEVMIRVRGGGSLSQDNSPLYIVDGFPVSSISDISPSEIETIDVLKDASSTAIYGAQGANGVVIVTTKSGKEGNVQINFNASMGWKKVTKTLGVLNPYEYAYYQYELSSGTRSNTDAGSYGDYANLNQMKGAQGNDWQEEIFGRTGVQHQYSLNVSGGTKETTYNVGFSHNDEKAIMIGSAFYKNNINAKLKTKLNNWLTLDFNARLAHQKIEGLSGGSDTNQSNASNSVVARTVTWRPVEGVSALADSDNSGDDDEDSGGQQQANPLQRVLGTHKIQKRLEQRYNVGLSWKPWKHWTFRTEVGYTWNHRDTEQVWDKWASQSSKYGGGSQPQAQFVTLRGNTFRNSNTITYDNKKLFGGRDALNVMVGQEWTSKKQSTRTNTSINYPQGYTIDDVLRFTAAGTPLQNEVTLDADDNMLSFFGRVNYTMMDKYLLTFTLREDGSSKFSKGNRWGLFPSLALAWRMSDEDWLKDVDWLSNLKMRLSFGTAGNNRINSDLYDVFYSLSGASDRNPYFGEQSTVMLNPKSDLYNNNLKWETTITRNFGIDYGFFRGRLNGSIDLYWNTTKDLLMRTVIPGNAGYPYQYQNFGKTSNKGIELTVNGVIIDKKNFSLNGNFNISYNRSNIDELNANASSWQTYNFGGTSPQDLEVWKIEEGGRLGEIYGYKTNGFYTVYDATTGKGDLKLNDKGEWVMADGSTPTLLAGYTLAPGTVKIVDSNGDGKITEGTKEEGGDKVRLGNTIPEWTGGFGFDAQWRTNIGTFDATVFCNFSLGNKILNATKMQNSYYWDTKSGYNIISEYSLDKRFTYIDPATGLNLVNPHNNTISAYGGYDAVTARLAEINANASVASPVGNTKTVITDQFVEDASFLRIQNITVGYTLPKAWVKKILMQSCRIYFTAYNVACFTGYSGYDPEVNVSSKKNAMCPGVDYAAYPKSRSYIMGINLTF